MTRGRKTENGAQDAETAKVEPDQVDPRESSNDEGRDDPIARMEAMMERLEERESALAAREAALAPREREHQQLSKDRAHDDTARLERQSLDYYAPPGQLEVPQSGEYHYRWIAEHVNGTHMPKQVQDRLREGYQRVMIDQLPEDFLVDEDRFRDGCARQSGLILMRIPKAKQEARVAYWQNLSRSRVDAADTLQGVAGRDFVKEDRGSRSLTGAEAGRMLKSMSTS